MLCFQIKKNKQKNNIQETPLVIVTKPCLLKPITLCVLLLYSYTNSFMDSIIYNNYFY